MSSGSGTRKGAFAFAVLFGAIGAGAEVWQIVTIGQHRPVDAVVLSTSVRTIADFSERPASRSYMPDVAFQYTVGRRSYIGHRFQALNLSGLGSWARRRAAEFQPGMRVTAYYDPNDPSDAFLINEVSLFPLAFMFGVPAIIWAVVSYDRRREERDRQAAALRAS